MLKHSHWKSIPAERGWYRFVLPLIVVAVAGTIGWLIAYVGS